MVFVILYTIFHSASLKKSAIIYLFGSSWVNILILMSGLPVQIITTAAGDWIFGDSPKVQQLSCDINAYFVGLSTLAVYYILAMISADRFFYLVKSLVYKKYFRPRFTMLVLVSTMVFLALYAAMCISLGPSYFSPITLLCVPPLEFVSYVISLLTACVVIVPVIIIAVTTVWTCLFTHQFIKKSHKRQAEHSEGGKDALYMKRVAKLFGVFSLLLLSQAISIFACHCPLHNRSIHRHQ